MARTDVWSASEPFARDVSTAVRVLVDDALVCCEFSALFADDVDVQWFSKHLLHAPVVSEETIAAACAATAQVCCCSDEENDVSAEL